MIGSFQKLLGDSEDYNGSFRVEGITITIPSAIGFHRDTMNCDHKGMKSVVSINVNVPFNNETVPPHTPLHQWLKDRNEKVSHTNCECSFHFTFLVLLASLLICKCGTNFCDSAPLICRVWRNYFFLRIALASYTVKICGVYFCD